MVTIHYFFDPMCGWCYGASDLLEPLVTSPQFNVVFHPGGMLNQHVISSEFRQHIIGSDERIAAETGAVFGDAYLQRVKQEREFILDSYLPTLAILTAEKLSLDPWVMLKAIQSAHYQSGLKVNEPSTLKSIAETLGLDTSDWDELMEQNQTVLINEIHSSQQLMSQLQVSGFPTLLVEKEGQFFRIPHTAYYGKPEQWQDALQQLQ
ncbi:DsbA family protein [Vibrio sp. dhg]|uniref:DsbA family protein n=1 Tax=Vibrio sp. dhg TaxID=2163016 RepID=UPI000E481126|nr:DsbA family protein [Vibrio sp. dhg]AXT73391.1 protein-disulfide isomerase [Vibrio sp. dhg]